MSVFSDRLKELRLSTKAKQTDIAEYLGVLPRTIRSYESGSSEPNFEYLNKLADYFNVSVDYLLGRVNYTQDIDGRINVKVPADIFNLDTDELKKKLGQE